MPGSETRMQPLNETVFRYLSDISLGVTNNVLSLPNGGLSVSRILFSVCLMDVLVCRVHHVLNSA